MSFYTMFDSVNQQLPYIPPPDYTMRYKPQPLKPIIEPVQKHQLKDDPGKPHHYTPEIRRPIQRQRPVSTMIENESLEKTRSQSPKEVQRRVLRMLKEQGVPVFPTTPLTQIVKQGNAVNLGPTRAYIKHLENHRKYDTLNSFRSCDGCALCKQMQKEIRILEQGLPSPQRRSNAVQHHYQAEKFSQPASNYNHHHKKSSADSRSEIISGRLFEPLQEVDVEEFPAEPEEFADSVVEKSTKMSERKATDRASHVSHRPNYHCRSFETQTSHSTASPSEHRRRIIHVPEARVRQDFVAKTSQQLSVKADDKVRVIQTDVIWSLCTTHKGKMGWVPSNNLQFERSSSLDSNLDSA